MNLCCRTLHELEARNEMVSSRNILYSVLAFMLFAVASPGICQTVPQQIASKFDEFSPMAFNDEKARLDNFAIELQSQPGALGYVIVYGTCIGEGGPKADRARNYLVNTRQLDSSRIVTLQGSCKKEFTVELWSVPAGATPPTPSTEGTVTPCPRCAKPKPQKGKSKPGKPIRRGRS